MILLDMSQLMMANLFVNSKNSEISEDMIRHMTVNSIRLYKNKYSKKYGDIVLVFDSTNYWRKDVFPLYKATRKVRQDNDGKDWNKIFGIFNKLREELQTTFPYKSLRIPRLEADDIIAILARKYHTHEKIMIVSSDKDFQQLQRYPNVEQYSPHQRKMLNCEDPLDFLLTHIIKGDTSDGIPNVLSDDDALYNQEKRQTPCGVKKIQQVKDDLSEQSPTHWERNQSLVDFEKIPDWVITEVSKHWEEPIVGKKSSIFNYFIKHRLKNLMENIGEF